MPHKTLRWAALSVKAVCAAVIFLATVQTLLILAPAMETRFWPPVSKLTILSMTENENGHTVVDAYFTKIRECEYIGISWFQGDPAGQFERVPILVLRREGDTSSPNRPVGSQKAGPWIISLPMEQVKGNSFSRLYHRCNPLYVTTTDFYP